MSLALDVFFNKRQLDYGNDCPNCFPDDYIPPPMEPVKVDWTWLERYSLEKLSGDELLAIWEQLSIYNGYHGPGVKDLIRQRLKRIGKEVRLGRHFKKRRKKSAPKSIFAPPPPPPPVDHQRAIISFRTIIPKRDVVRAKLIDLLRKGPQRAQVQHGDIVQGLSVFRYDPSTGNYTWVGLPPS